MQKNTSLFGYMPDGRSVLLITLTNQQGASVSITNYGAKLVSLFVPDKYGTCKDIVLGYSKLDDYISGNRYFGSNPGRVSGRISNAQFSLKGKIYHLTKGENHHHLHGGARGFDSILWDYEVLDEKVIFSYLSPDGEEGYPGNLNTKIMYEWTDDSELKISYMATTDQATPLCITHHSYFNLCGEESGNIGGHEVQIFADEFLETNSDLIPTGKRLYVAGSLLDLRTSHVIHQGLQSTEPSLLTAGGYDHCYVLQDLSTNQKLAAVVKEPVRGLKMEVFTTYPCIVFYTGNGCDGIVPGKSGIIAGHQSAFCLEPQLFTNAVNISEFPSCILYPTEKYFHKIMYKFSYL